MSPRAHKERANRLSTIAMMVLAAPALACMQGHADDSPAPVRRHSIPVDSARFVVGGRTALHGTFAGDVRLDALSIGEATFTHEDGKLHEIAAVRVWAIDGSGNARAISDEELARGPSPVRILAARDLELPPTTALDSLSGLSISTSLISDGTEAIRIDVLFPAGMKDNKPGAADRAPEIVLVGPTSNSTVRVSAIVAGDLEDPTVADGFVDVSPQDMDEARVGVSIIFGQTESPRPISILGYDLDDLGVADLPAYGVRLEIPRGATFAAKIFGTGESETEMLASADVGADFSAALGLIGDGPTAYGDPGPIALPSGFPDSPHPFVGNPDGPGGDGGGSVNPTNPPSVPAPSALALLAAALAVASPRRRR